MLAVLVAVTFVRVPFGAYVYDDLQLIVANPHLNGEAGWWAAVWQPLWGPEFPHWRPLTQGLLAAGHAALGAAGIHLLALSGHLAAVLLVQALVAKITRQPTTAFFVALWFGVHPAQVESVAWCAALNDVLWGALALLALWLHAADRARGEPGPTWRVVGCFALALLAKETAIVVPALVACFDATLGGPHGAGSRWRRYPRFLAAVAPWFLARMVVFESWYAGFERGPTLAGGRGALALAGEIFGRLVGALVWPFAPDALRPMPEAGAGLRFVGLAAATIAMVVWAWRRAARATVFGLGVAVVVLAAHAAGPRGLGEYPIADRYLYLAVFGAALAGVPGLLLWRYGRVMAALVACAFAAVSFAAVGAWAGQRAFVHAQLERGDDARVHYMAGQLALEASPRDLGAAERAFARAAELAVAPRHGGEEGRARLQADVAAGQAWCAFFRAAAAPIPDFRPPAAMFARILHEHETHAPAHVGLAVCLAELGDPASAERHLLRALELDPAQPAARANLARLRSLRR